MNAKRLRELAKNPKHITGIFNYCDRWCERCPFTARCLLFAQNREAGIPELKDMDLNNKKFWEALHESFALTKEMILEDMKEHGIEITEEDIKAADKKIRKKKATVKKSNLPDEAMKYIKAVDAWFKVHEGEFEEKQLVLQSIENMKLPGVDPAAKAADILDCVDIVRWYEHQIYVKIRRALSGAPDDEDDESSAPEDEFLPSDSDGSAKVALIGMDRSVMAWGKLRGHFPDESDAILTILVHLDRLRRNAEKRFPKARKFHRPGLDD